MKADVVAAADGDLWCEDCAASFGVPADEMAMAGEADGIHHCAGGNACFNRIDLAAYGLDAASPLFGAETRQVGIICTDRLTTNGYEALQEALAEPKPTPFQAALHRLWEEEFGS